MSQPKLPAARKFVEAVRGHYAAGHEDAELWKLIERDMHDLLADAGLQEESQKWPATVESAPTVGNLLFYEDPNFGFVLNATVRQPHVITNVHDHGDVWTLYGLIVGTETMHRYERIDGGVNSGSKALLEMVGAHTIGPGDIDVVPPGKIHQEHAGPEQSIAFIVRGRRPGTFPQHNFDPDTGSVVVTNGPRQIPHAL